MADIQSLIESAAAGNREDFRTLMLSFFGQFTLINNTQGLNWLDPTSTVQNSATSAPPQATATVTAANGIYVVQITNPKQGAVSKIFHEVSFSTVKNFSQNVTVLPQSQNTYWVIPAPGATLFIRLRSSYDLSKWNNYKILTFTAASSKLQSSAATENNVVLNQSNFANVDSVAIGATAAVRVYGTAGAYKSYVAVKGTQQVVRPSATIVNVDFGSTHLVAYDGQQFRLASILPGVFPDTWEPVGQVSVVESGVPVLPTVALILGSGGSVIGWNVLTQGNGLTGPVTLTIVTAGGAGATYGAQTIQSGKLISIAPGNPGAGYGSGDTVTVTGGVGSGSPGGGTAVGGNGGRLTKI